MIPVDGSDKILGVAYAVVLGFFVLYLTSLVYLAWS